jgi:prepilin-type N-terminal cleavage/methylation domain-containing protein
MKTQNIKNQNNTVKKEFQKAFTIIELLVVVAIISVLTGVMLMGLDGVKQRGNDVKRIADIREMQTAIETYKSVNGKYPAAGAAGSNEYIVGLLPFMSGSKLQKDPSGIHNGTAGYIYQRTTDEKTYCITVKSTVYNSKSQKDLEDGTPKTWKVCKGKDAASPSF